MTHNRLKGKGKETMSEGPAPEEPSMRIIRCEKCEKRYIVRETDNRKKISKYRCKACSHIIVVDGSKNEQDSDQTQTAEEKQLETRPRDEDSRPPITTSLTKKETITLNFAPDETAPRSLGLRAKFNLAICAALVCAIVMIYFFADSRLQKDAQNQVSEKARILLTTMEESRSFTSKVIKPALYQALPERFIVEGMSSSFCARSLFEGIQESYPDYYFKHAAAHPRNPINQADVFEMSIIEQFTANPELKEWQGYRSRGEEKVYCIMKPIVAEKRCMRCHSDPALAPQELLDRYEYIHGNENGFNRTVGEVIGTLTVAVPASVAIESARNKTMLFIEMVVVSFVILALIVNFFFSRMILTPIKNLADNADDISMGRFETHIDTTGTDEIGKLANAFERMKISIKMVVDHLAK